MILKNTTIPAQSERYLSLDVLRGLTVALMIVVNTPGSWSAIYAPFKHSDWHGYTPTDWVFPAFLFVVGNALSFSMARLKTISATQFHLKVFKRTVLMFLIGLFLNAFPFVNYEEGNYVLKDLSNLRLWGVLQRIAVCYFFASLMIYYFSKTVLIISSVFILLFYWFVLSYFGDFTLEGNVIGKVDLAYLSPKNMYKHYNPVAFDPMGLLSAFPAIIDVIAGYLVGVFIKNNGNGFKTIIKMSFFGVLFIIIAMFWDNFLPINKPLWTSSYVAMSTGLNLIILTVLMVIIEVYNFKKWTYFFEVFGKNPLFIYVMAWIVISLMGIIRVNGIPIKSIIYSNLFTNWLSPLNASLMFSIVYMLLMWCIGYVMDKNKIYVKL